MPTPSTCDSLMLAHAQQATNLTFTGDIQPTSEQCKAFTSQLHVHIINILFEFSEAFKGFQHQDDSQLIHVDYCKRSEGHCTKQYPLQTSTIDENSISGNIAIVNDVYTNQLKLSPEKCFDHAVPSINNQSTLTISNK